MFVDEAGTRCAMGEVLFHAAGEGLVERVHETANEATIDQLSGDGELNARLEAIGFTLEEAALVQPMYRWCEPYRALQVCSYGVSSPELPAPLNISIYVMDGGQLETSEVLSGQAGPFHPDVLELSRRATPSWAALPDGTRMLIAIDRQFPDRVLFARGERWIADTDALCAAPLSLSDAEARRLVQLPPQACLQSLAAMDGRWLLLACESYPSHWRPGDLRLNFAQGAQHESFCREDGSFRQEIVQPREAFNHWLRFRLRDAGLPEDVYDANLAPVELPAASVETFPAGCHTGAASPAIAAAALLVTLRLHRRLRRRHDDR
ncbi:MAG: hypothetical protein Q8S33_28845 [Myxococcales bacterium]|nr:hypothetical protein [Myxococcales bacterium]